MGFIRKIKQISKTMTSKIGKQTITIHILPNISISTGNQRIKFCQSWRPLPLPQIKLHNETKRGLEPVSLGKNISLVMFYNWSNSSSISISISNQIIWFSLFREILVNVYCNYLLTRLWRNKFWNLSFWSSCFFYLTKSQDILRTIEN